MKVQSTIMTVELKYRYQQFASGQLYGCIPKFSNHQLDPHKIKVFYNHFQTVPPLQKIVDFTIFLEDNITSIIDQKQENTNRLLDANYFNH